MSCWGGVKMMIVGVSLKDTGGNGEYTALIRRGYCGYTRSFYRLEINSNLIDVELFKNVVLVTRCVPKSQ